jgi:hypothetical protein
MIVVYNTITHVWDSTVDGAGFSQADGWIYEPTFENEQFARSIGSEFWTFDGNLIKTPTPSEYAAIYLVRRQDAMWRQIQAERDRRTANGVRVGANWFHSDVASRIQQLGLVVMGAALPTGIMWKTKGGTFVEMTPQLAGQIFQAVAMNDTVIFTIAEMRRGAMMAQPVPESYDFLTGSPAWPATFGE